MVGEISWDIAVFRGIYHEQHLINPGQHIIGNYLEIKVITCFRIVNDASSIWPGSWPSELHYIFEQNAYTFCRISLIIRCDVIYV